MKSRILIVFAVVLSMWTLLVLRAASLQILPDNRLANLKKRQFETQITLKSRRGAIVDRNGRDLALSARAWSLYADPKLIQQPLAVSRNLAKILGVPTNQIQQKIKDKKRRFIWIERMLDQETMEKVKELKVSGLAFVEEFKRIYPNESLAAQVLGFVGLEGHGLDGIELQYNDSLDGDKKKVVVRRDARGRPLAVDGVLFTENPDGRELELTLDGDIQHMLEKELEQALTEFEAEAAYGVVLDARDSGVLAIASAPTFDANRSKRLAAERRRNRSAADAFEPGSTMKTFVVAAGLREKILQANSRYDTEGGRMKIGGRTIREADARYKWDSLTVSEILAFSSNIGTTKIAFDLGPELMRKTLMDFGFGEKTGIDLPGEAKGIMHALPWRSHLFSNISFGHGMTASPLQIANAYAAIANGGVLKKPYLVRSIKDPDTGRIQKFHSEDVRQVLTPEDAAALRLMLAGATATGATGVNARVDGFPVAGKTGTAQKVNPHGRGYIPGGYISSFAGFLPANNPEFVIFIAIDHPKKKNTFYGSRVAAPIFSRVASYAARKRGLAPVLLSDRNVSRPAGLRDDSMQMRKQALRKIEQQDRVDDKLSQDLVPDLLKLSSRDVLRRLRAQDIQVQFRGQGVVAEIYPPAGSPMPEDKKLTIRLSEDTH